MAAIDVKYNEISSLKHLRTLALGASEIGQGLFLALGQLPCLETLSLHTDDSQPKQTRSDPIDIPDDSFLALRHLALYGLSESSIRCICTRPPLFRHLVKASFVSPERSLRKIADRRDLSLVIAECLGHNSPHLTDLTVFSPGLDSCLVLYDPAVLDVFRHTPLRRLRLDRARLKSWGDIDDLDSDDSDADEGIGPMEIQWRDFLLTMPHLEELHLDLQVLVSRHLPVFASTLPNLQLLVLMGVLLEDGEVSTVQAATQPITLRCPFYVDTEDHNEWANASGVAKFIYRIWPNAQFEVKRSMSWIYYDEPLDEAARVIATFNEAIELLRSSE
ncbi:hypothetical protein FRC06_010902 [Ceratobasidium sp. 370]|nr:hypothetical protein FRC06_010902 [Ceratobasidium sp. 370]